MSEIAVVRVMSGLVVLEAVSQAVLPDFNASSGWSAAMIWDPTAVLMQRIANGERADAIIATRSAIDQLAAGGLVDAGSQQALVRSALDVAVTKGARRPDISSVEALKRTLLEARSVAFSRSGISGVQFERLLEQLGIANDVRERATILETGLTAEKLVSGEADLAVQQVSELIAVPGVELLGPLPAEIAATADFDVAGFASAANPEGGRAFIAALLTPQARSAYVRTGLVPLFDA